MTKVHLNVDFHIHTYHSPCAKSEMIVRDIARMCMEKGIYCCGISDHIHVDTNVKILEENRRDINDAADIGVKMFLGCEVDVLDIGKTALCSYVQRNTDYIMLSANHFTAPGVNAPDKNLPPHEIALHFLRMLKYACSLDCADIVVHPLYVFPHTYDPACLNTLSDDELLEAIYTANAHKTAFELTPRALMASNAAFMKRFYTLCKGAGCKFSIGSDSHNLRTIEATAYLAPLLDDLQITDEDIWYPSL